MAVSGSGLSVSGAKGCAGRDQTMGIWDDGNGLCVDGGGGYVDIFIYHNSSDCVLKKSVFYRM